MLRQAALSMDHHDFAHPKPHIHEKSGKAGKSGDRTDRAEGRVGDRNYDEVFSLLCLDAWGLGLFRACLSDAGS